MAITEATLKAAVTGSGITPEQPLPQAPKEIQEMNFSFDPALMSGGDNSTIKTDEGVTLKETPAEIKTEPKVEDKLVVEETTTAPEPKVQDKTQPKVEDRKPVTTDTKPVKKQFTPVKDKTEVPDQFDYTKFAPHEVEAMKNMSRSARAAHVKLIEENKQLASLKDASYLQHDKGYTLSPEYSELVAQDRNARLEGQAWENAMISIMAGKPYQQPVGFDENGRIVLSPEQNPTDRDQIRVQNNIHICTNASNQCNQKLQTFPNQFKQRVTQDLQEIQNERAARFAWVSDPKLLDHPVEVEGGGQQKVSEIRNNFKSLLPVYHRNSPIAEVAADLMVALMISSAELREAKSGRVIAEVKQKEAARGEPTSDNVDTAPITKVNGKGIPRTFTMEGFPS